MKKTGLVIIIFFLFNTFLYACGQAEAEDYYISADLKIRVTAPALQVIEEHGDAYTLTYTKHRT